MSTRPPASFIQVNHSTAEQDASHSALFYLFQEVSKLASPTHSSFLDTSSPSRWLYETSKQDNVIVKREEDGGCSFQSYQHSLKEETHSSKFTTSVEAHHECRSPWKVLSMINLHCERLMHRTYVEDSDRSSVSSTAKLHKGHPTAKLLAAEADVTEQGCVTPVEDGSGDCTQGVNNCKPQCCVHVSKMKSGVVRPQTAEKTDAVIPELMKENTTSFQHQHGDKREFNFSVNGQLVQNQECVFDSFSTEQDILKVPFSKNPLPLTHIPGASKNMKLTFNLNENAPICLSKKPPTLDYNANITGTTEPQCDNQLPHPSSVLPSQCKSLQKEENKRTGPVECTHVPTEEELVSGQLKSCNESSATSKQDVQKEDVSPSLIQQWRIKTPRKQPHPSRSVDIQDPDLQGVTFRMDTEVDDSREQCRLLITSKYSKELAKSVRKPRLRTRTSQRSLKTSSSEEESDSMSSVSKGKVCASCCTRKTPMWRDAEDGTPLCNACGIRYKKYRVRCVNCWHIPRKEGNSNSSCLKCGNFVKLASALRKHIT